MKTMHTHFQQSAFITILLILIRNWRRGETFAIQNFLNRLRPVPIFRKDVFKDRQNPNPNLPKDWCEIKIELFGIECESDIEELRKLCW